MTHLGRAGPEGDFSEIESAAIWLDFVLEEDFSEDHYNVLRGLVRHMGKQGGVMRVAQKRPARKAPKTRS